MCGNIQPQGSLSLFACKTCKDTCMSACIQVLIVLLSAWHLRVIKGAISICIECPLQLLMFKMRRRYKKKHFFSLFVMSLLNFSVITDDAINISHYILKGLNNSVFIKLVWLEMALLAHPCELKLLFLSTHCIYQFVSAWWLWCLLISCLLAVWETLFSTR